MLDGFFRKSKILDGFSRILDAHLKNLDGHLKNKAHLELFFGGNGWFKRLKIKGETPD